MELPHIEKLYRETKAQGFGLITVTQDSIESVKRMVEYNGITHPIVSDISWSIDTTGGRYSMKHSKTFEDYHAYDGKHYLIDGNGKIVGAFSKLGISMPMLLKELEKYGIKSKPVP